MTFLFNEYSNGYRISETITFYLVPLLYWTGIENNRMTKFTKIVVLEVLIVTLFIAALNVTGVV